MFPALCGGGKQQRVNKTVSVIPRSEATWESVTQKSEMY